MTVRNANERGHAGLMSTCRDTLDPAVDTQSVGERTSSGTRGTSGPGLTGGEDMKEKTTTMAVKVEPRGPGLARAPPGRRGRKDGPIQEDREKMEKGG